MVGVEFGHVGDGYHDPNELVISSSPETYRQALGRFVQILGANRSG